MSYHSFAEQFMAGAANRGSQAAVRCENGEVFTFLQIASAVRQFSATMHERGVRAGARVVLGRLRNIELLIGFLAVSRLGGTSIIANDVTPDLRSVLKPEYAVGKSDDGTSIIPVILFPDRFTTAELDASFAPKGYAQGSIASCIIGSSGSTGKRKYFSLSAEQITLTVADQVSILPRPMRRTLLTVPPRARYGLQMTLTVIQQGGCVIWAEPVEELALICGGEVDHVVGAPLVYSSYMDKLLATPLTRFALDFCIVGGSKISDVFAEKIRRALRCDLFVQYGSTEMGPIAIGSTEELAQLPDYSGKLAPWATAWTVGDKGERLPPGHLGRLVFELRSPRIVASRLSAAATEQELSGADRIYVSDDFGSVVDESILLIESRFQDRINVGGNKTSLSTIRKKITEITSKTLEMEVLAIKTEEGYDRVVVVMVGEPGELSGFIQSIEKSKITKDRFQVMCVNRLPLNEFGKVDTQKLRSVAESEYIRNANGRGGI